MSNAMDDEFDTMARWTAAAAIELGPQFRLPAGCRGSGGPQALTWLLDAMQLGRNDVLLDAGAGVGGPSAFARDRADVRPVLSEPAAGACAAARQLFGLPVVQAGGQALPFATDSVDAAWSLAVLCTTENKRALLTELGRVVRGSGAIGLVVYVRTTTDQPDAPEGNSFPSADELAGLFAHARLRVTASVDLDDLGDSPEEWDGRAAAVEDRIEELHGHDKAWRTAHRQADQFGGLLADGTVVGRVLTLRR